jgi:hypothetical protein
MTNPTPLPLLDKRWLLGQCVLHITISSISKDEEPMHVITAISIGD